MTLSLALLATVNATLGTTVNATLDAAVVAGPPAAASSSSAWLAAGFILLAVGVAIAVLEMFVPSGGILAVAAATALIGSVACFFAYDTMAGATALALYAAGAPIAVVLGLKVWTHTPLAKSMVLGGVEGDNEGRAPELDTSRMHLVGKSGVAMTLMRPVGFVRMGEDRIEAQAETGMIEPGTRVTVIECDGPRVTVRPSAE